jgi:uncharacterized DUF497 family protein
VAATGIPAADHEFMQFRVAAEDLHPFLILGLSAATRVLLVVHLERGERIRLISARVATRRERARMEREG